MATDLYAMLPKRRARSISATLLQVIAAWLLSLISNFTGTVQDQAEFDSNWVCMSPTICTAADKRGPNTKWLMMTNNPGDCESIILYFWIICFP